jgi:hypothetical protein
MKRKGHDLEQKIRNLRTAGQLFNQGQTVSVAARKDDAPAAV